MGNIKETLRNTPLLPVWHFVKTKPPVKQMRSLAGKWRRYYTLKIKLPHIYRKYASQPVDEKKVVFFEVNNLFKLYFLILVIAAFFDWFLTNLQGNLMINLRLLCPDPYLAEHKL